MRVDIFPFESKGRNEKDCSNTTWIDWANPKNKTKNVHLIESKVVWMFIISGQILGVCKQHNMK